MLAGTERLGGPEDWPEEQTGPLVRPYAVTRGRTKGAESDLQLITLVVSDGPASRAAVRDLDPEHLQILTLCRRPVSVAELSARLGLPLPVLRILISELVERRLIGTNSASVPDPELLAAVIRGIRRL